MGTACQDVHGGCIFPQETDVPVQSCLHPTSTAREPRAACALPLPRPLSRSPPPIQVVVIFLSYPLQAGPALVPYAPGNGAAPYGARLRACVVTRRSARACDAALRAQFITIAEMAKIVCEQNGADRIYRSLPRALSFLAGPTKADFRNRIWVFLKVRARAAGRPGARQRSSPCSPPCC